MIRKLLLSFSLLLLFACNFNSEPKVQFGEISKLAKSMQVNDSIKINRNEMSEELLERLNQLCYEANGTNFDLDSIEIIYLDNIEFSDEKSRGYTGYYHFDNVKVNEGATGRHCSHSAENCSHLGSDGSCSSIGHSLVHIYSTRSDFMRSDSSAPGGQYQVTEIKDYYYCSNYVDWNNCCNLVYWFTKEAHHAQ